ncbi:DMT family transporter [Aestuariivirga sp.]|uniref:DMT family transporter n=1 Tax=Aestuariivirga sp. TaxID=2650926 RepID=UPI003BA98217
MTRDYRLGMLLVTASAVAWSTAGFFTRLVPLDSWTMLAWRGLFGAFGIAFVILAMERRQAWGHFRALGWPGWIFALVSAAGMICFITALRHTSVAHVAVIYALAPFIAATLAWLAIRERPTRGALATSCIALLGVAIMAGFGTDGSPVGDLLALGMTICCAAMMVLARRYRDIPTLPAACLSALLSGLVCWPIGEPLALSAHSLLVLVLFGLVNSALGLTLFTVGARLLPAVETALIGSLDAPLAPLWVWIAFNEAPSPSTLTGGIIAFAAVGLHVWLSGAKKLDRPEEPDVRSASRRLVPAPAIHGDDDGNEAPAELLKNLTARSHG